MITQKIIARTDSLKLDKIISRYGEDSMRQVVFIIVRPDPESEDLIPITIPEDAVGSFRILKPSGNFVIVPMSKSVLATGETAFDVVLPASVNTAKGSGYYDIRITSDADKYYFTAQGDFLIDDNIISDEVLEDVSEVNGLIFPDDFLTVEDHVAYIDDDTISTDSTWSSDKISEEIEAHAGGDISKTVSGNPIEINDAASAPLVKCVTEIQGSQDLHGYDKPWVGGSGKNKFETTGTTTTIYGKTFTIKSDGSVSITGVADSNRAYVQLGQVVLNAGTYILSSGSPSNNYFIDFTFSVSGNQRVVTNESSITISQAEIVIVWLNAESASTPNNVMIYPMIRTSGDSTWEPYSNICPITAYTEGEIEVRGKNLWYEDYTGINQNTIKYKPIFVGDGTFTASTDLSYKGSASNLFFLAGRQSSGASTNTNGFGLNQSRTIASENGYVTIAYRLLDGDENYNPTKFHTQIEEGSTVTTYEPFTGNTTHTTTYPSAIYRGSEDCVNGTVTTEWGMIASYAGETLPGEWISDRDEYAPGTTPSTGAQVAYALATPTTSSVTPTNLPIKSLSGYTHIESSTGDMEVEYITEDYQSLVELINRNSTVYSTSERPVGTWVNGNTVYEKTLYYESLNVSRSDWTILDTITVDKFIDSSVTCTNNGRYLDKTYMRISYLNGNIYYHTPEINGTCDDVYVTIRYTKEV